MTTCLFLTFRYHATPSDGEKSKLNKLLGVTPKLLKALVHTSATASDPYVKDEAPPPLVVQLYFDEIHRLEAALARVGRFPKTPLLHTTRSKVSSLFRCNLRISSSTHSIQVCLPLPLRLAPATDITLHFDTQSSALLRSTCPNHRSVLRTTRSATPTIPNRSNNSCELFLSFSDTPHIHLTIILSVLSNCCVSVTFNAQVSLPYTITLCTHAL